MISCMIFDELSDRHMAELAKHRMEDGWEVALAQRAATDLAWEAVCEHRALCPLCKDKPQPPETIH